MGLRILITGGCGFVGSNLGILFKKKYPQYSVFAADNLKRKGSEMNLSRLREHSIEFIHGDIRNREDMNEWPAVDIVIDAAAEPSVLAGLGGGLDYVVNTNLVGTFNTLEYAARHGANMIFLSTSRVYPFDLLDSLAYTETSTRFAYNEKQSLAGAGPQGISTSFPLTGPRSFYGATKLASELLITEYREFLQMKAVVNRCGVITGPWQMGKVDQGVVVLWMARHFWKKGLTYNGYGGQGKQVRDILHFNDLFRLVDWQVHHLDRVNGMTFNVGGGNDCSISLQELTQICEGLTGNCINIEPVPENRKADVRIYTTDNTEVSRITGWKPEYDPGKIMKEIYDWINNYQDELKGILN